MDRICRPILDAHRNLWACCFGNFCRIRVGAPDAVPGEMSTTLMSVADGVVRTDNYEVFVPVPRPRHRVKSRSIRCLPTESRL